MKNITWRKRIRYEFDQMMSKGPISLVGWLFLSTLGLIFIVTALVEITRTDPDGRGFIQMMWLNFMHTLDSGAIGGDPVDSWPFLLSMLITTLGGIFLFSSFIGILTAALEQRLDQLRQGRSFVAETGHILILGWSPQVFTIISELVTANANLRRSCIVVLANEDKVEMEEAIANRIENTGRTRIVCRTGNPIDRLDLAIANPQTAKSIIILAPDADDPDVEVIKIILALASRFKKEAEHFHVIAPLQETKNVMVAEYAGENKVKLILAKELISRIAAQTCLQSGLSTVYMELLDFSGDEIYFHAEPALTGKTFREALMAYEKSAVIGIASGDKVTLSPPADTVLQAGDQLIAIAEDDDRFHLVTVAPTIDQALLARYQRPLAGTPDPQRILILGWNDLAPLIVEQLVNYLPPASSIMVVAQSLPDETQEMHFEQVTLAFAEGDTTDRDTLIALKVNEYQRIIVLSYDGDLSIQQADARTLVTLLHLRQMAELENRDYTIVSEMLDTQNRELAEVTHADDFIISDKLVSLILAQVAENEHLKAVFDDLFDPEGVEVYLKRAEQFVPLGQPVNFYTLLEAGLKQGATVMGYRIKAESYAAEKLYGIHLNPNKSDTVTFAAGDRLIVLAEN